MKLFPDDDRKGRILCHALTADFLYYGTDVRLGVQTLLCWTTLYNSATLFLMDVIFSVSAAVRGRGVCAGGGLGDREQLQPLGRRQESVP